MADPPPTPPRPTPPAGSAFGGPPLGKDIPENETLRRARTVRSGAIVMAVLWEE